VKDLIEVLLKGVGDSLTLGDEVLQGMGADHIAKGRLNDNSTSTTSIVKEGGIRDLAEEARRLMNVSDVEDRLDRVVDAIVDNGVDVDSHRVASEHLESDDQQWR